MDKFVCFNRYSSFILKMYCHPTNKNERLDHILWYFSTDHTTWGYKYVGKQGSAPALCAEEESPIVPTHLRNTQV